MLASRFGDLGYAEHAASEAFLAALKHWPKAGIPDRPEAWLFRVASNLEINRLKSASHRQTVSMEEMTELVGSAPIAEETDIPDRRLALLFVCSHPAIEVEIRTPLMLQAVLGVDAKRIAEAFAVPETMLAQRLVRAKKRIRMARIPFTLPDLETARQRLEAVLEAIYGAYAIDWKGVAGTAFHESLSAEALFLARLIVQLIPDDAEACGLAALICLSLARRPGRESANGDFVPLDSQSTDSWDRESIREGERYLNRAFYLKAPGRFQIEAAIQSAHCARINSGTVDWKAIEFLYTRLIHFSSTLGTRVSLASVKVETAGPLAALNYLDRIPDATLSRFQPAWALRAHILSLLKRNKEAKRAYEKALTLTTDVSLVKHLKRRMDGL
jgi:RNA polymerase sigma-70 factor (ECF subfamily)